MRSEVFQTGTPEGGRVMHREAANGERVIHRPVREKVKGERGIYRRTTKDGETRFEVCYLDSTGKQRWRTTASLRGAKALRADLVARVNKGEQVASSRVLFGVFADEWLISQETRLRPKTREWYGSCLRLHIKPRLGRLRVGEVTVDDVARLVVELEQEGKKPWTIRGVLTVLGRLFGSAERRGLIAANPVRRLEKGERPKVERREFPSLDHEGVGRLIANAPAKYRTLIALSVLTGVRQSEALGLRWRDVDTAAGGLRVRYQLSRNGELVEPKTAAAKRDIPIPASLARMLAEHRLASRYSGEGDFVFCSTQGTPLGHRNIVRRGLEPALARRGCSR
jgi:integrase